MERGFDDPEFDPNEWINNRLDPTSKTSLNDQVDQIITSMQLNSRNVSQTTDRNIQHLVSELPKAMAKISQIGSMVNDVSEALRSLTNSGYKFKSGNMPDKISELSSLKDRRDRLKEAMEILKYGIEFESTLKDLKRSTASGDLKTVCSKFKEVSVASEALKPIPKFANLGPYVTEIQDHLIGRLSQELFSACAQRSVEKFTLCVTLSQQIYAETLPKQVADKFFKDKVFENLQNFSSVNITVWLEPCLKECYDLIISFSEWCLSLNYALFDESIRVDFVRIVSQVVAGSVEAKCRELMDAHSFSDLVTVVGIISDFFLRLPVDWNIQEQFFFKNCIDEIHSTFPNALQAHLTKQLAPPKPMPKSMTAGSLNRIAPPSPSRSSDRLVSTEAIRTEPFDKTKLGKFIDVAKKAQEWIKVLPKDPIRCMQFVIQFLADAVHITAREIVVDTKDYARIDDGNYVMELGSLISLYTFEKDQEKNIMIFVNDAVKTYGNDSNNVVKAISALDNALEQRIVTAMASRSLLLLDNIKAAQEWSIVLEFEEDTDIMSHQQSQYIQRIIECFIRLVGCLGENDMNDEITKRWMSKVAEKVAQAYVTEIIAIPKLSRLGQVQLHTDISYFKRVMSEAMSLSIGDDLESILSYLGADPSDRENVKMSEKIANAMKLSVGK